jgi:hypothetical protein
MFLHNLLNVLVQIANKMGLQKKKSAKQTGTCKECVECIYWVRWRDVVSTFLQLQLQHRATYGCVRLQYRRAACYMLIRKADLTHLTVSWRKRAHCTLLGLSSSKRTECSKVIILAERLRKPTRPPTNVGIMLLCLRCAARSRSLHVYTMGWARSSGGISYKGKQSFGRKVSCDLVTRHNGCCYWQVN